VGVGTSGGLTWAGTLAALAGAALIGLTAADFAWAGAFQWIGLNRAWSAVLVALVISFAGLFGSLFDSWLGATMQAMYFCDHCAKETERHPTHTCGNSTRRLRGWRWLDNDWVNFISSVAGAAVAGGVWLWRA
jgi:uncharacterized membrane protein